VSLTAADFVPIWPELLLLVMVCVILIADLFLHDDQRNGVYVLSLLSLAACAVVTVVSAGSDVSIVMHGMFVDDPMSDALKVMVYLAVGAMLVYSRNYIEVRGMFRGEFYTLVLFATLGMMVMISANHFLSLYLGLELLSLSMYALVALQRDSAESTESAMKYFVLGALASGMLLYGMSMIYGATGSLEIPRVAERIATGQANANILVFGLVFVVAGLGFKFGAVPFHMWVPDVYQGAPTAVALFISTAPKLAAFAFAIRLLVESLGHPSLLVEWQQMLAILAVLSMAIGNITAIAQTNLKRMLAYSTISHMGFLLLGLMSGTVDGYGAAMFYVAVYAFMGLGTFGMIMLLSRKGFEADRIEDFKGLNRRSPWCAFLMLLLMFSLAGVPPTVGFYAKLSVLQAALDAGYIGLTVVAVLLSLVGAFYYLRIVRLMYFDEPTDTAPIVGSTGARVLLSVNGLAALVIGIVPGWLMTLCQQAMRASL
jgi:NADH-quinone oxidoreductase subunit N